MEVLDDFKRLILSNGRQSKFLEIFEIVQINKNDFILENQQKLLSILLTPKHRNFLLYQKEYKDG